MFIKNHCHGCRRDHFGDRGEIVNRVSRNSRRVIVIREATKTLGCDQSAPLRYGNGSAGKDTGCSRGLQDPKRGRKEGVLLVESRRGKARGSFGSGGQNNPLSHFQDKRVIADGDSTVKRPRAHRAFRSSDGQPKAKPTTSLTRVAHLDVIALTINRHCTPKNA